MLGRATINPDFIQLANFIDQTFEIYNKLYNILTPKKDRDNPLYTETNIICLKPKMPHNK